MPRSTRKGKSSDRARALGRGRAPTPPPGAPSGAAARADECTAGPFLLMRQLQLLVAGMQGRMRERRLAGRIEQGGDGEPRPASAIEFVRARRASRGGRRTTGPVRRAARCRAADAGRFGGRLADARFFDRTSDEERPPFDADGCVGEEEKSSSGVTSRLSPRDFGPGLRDTSAMFFGIADYPSFVVAVIVFLMIPGPATWPSSPRPARAACAAAWPRRSA